MKKIYVFGNKDLDIDNIAIKVSDEINHYFSEIIFQIQDPNDDFLPDEKEIVILDAAKGIDKITTFNNLDLLLVSPRVTLHDFDIAFNLKLLKKIGRIEKVTIIAIPADKTVDEIYQDLINVIKTLIIN